MGRPGWALAGVLGGILGTVAVIRWDQFARDTALLLEIGRDAAIYAARLAGLVRRP